VRATFTITVLAWSKTAFAITFLGFTERPLKLFIWFIIVSTNMAFAVSGLLFWVQCKPLAAAWDVPVVGTTA